MKKKKPQKKVTRKKKSKASSTTTTVPSVHPWRACPYGQHAVITHPMHVPPSKTHPGGSVTTRHFHCAHNPSGKDELRPDEIKDIGEQHFATLKDKPCSLPLKFGAAGSKNDDLIAGWVQYWNDVLKPDVPLDPNLVKALIASESGFNSNALANPDNSNSARGLTQITNATRKLISGDTGGLKDHLIIATKNDLNDPAVNICAGVRWLFEKRRLASSRLKRPASWIDAVWEYKGTTNKPKKDVSMIEIIFNKFYEDYQKCGK